MSLPSSPFCSLQETYEAKRNEFMGELQKKEEEMRQMFVQRVKEKESELKEAEKEVSVEVSGSLWRLQRLFQVSARTLSYILSPSAEGVGVCSIENDSRIQTINTD